ncbi:cytochrome c oxidase assembly protein [Thalassospiraceae bacterium LMO-SO8]|nr:cytochrome c oxidase assembly protein [Alphaproteobacteria bacterium LMO-S08]WND76533.1 cytochrome c oxidase assembly protein [Thalassospiraceae bacterium LMO-SO8]
MSRQPRNSNNRRTALALFAVVGGMVGLSYASVPLYQLFCQVTGYGGTTQVSDAGAKTVSSAMQGRTVTIAFDANVARDLNWDFRPEQRRVTLHAGEQALAFYSAKNDESTPVTGTASFNVTPYKAGIYFTKIECFCFTEQTLQAGQQVDMPVQFYVDPEFFTDPNTKDVREIVLSYTFHRAADAASAVQKTSAVAVGDARPGG